MFFIQLICPELDNSHRNNEMREQKLGGLKVGRYEATQTQRGTRAAIFVQRETGLTQ